MTIRYAKNFKDRLFGFAFKKNINEMLVFKKCNAIHTFFMKEPIDVIMTDKNKTILYVFYNVKPNRIILPKKNVYYTYELPSNKFRFNVNEIMLDNQIQNQEFAPCHHL